MINMNKTQRETETLKTVCLAALLLTKLHNLGLLGYQISHL